MVLLQQKFCHAEKAYPLTAVCTYVQHQSNGCVYTAVYSCRKRRGGITTIICLIYYHTSKYMSCPPSPTMATAAAATVQGQCFHATSLQASVDCSCCHLVYSERQTTPFAILFSPLLSNPIRSCSRRIVIAHYISYHIISYAV